MICPRCKTELKRTERTDRTCSSCKRPFALEPKENPLQLHDVRVHRLAGRLGAEGRHTYTVPQLWYAAARGRIPAVDHDYEGCLPVAFGMLTVAVLITGAATDFGSDAFVIALLIALALLVLAVISVVTGRRKARRWGRVEVPMQLHDFRGTELVRWQQVYGALPAGCVDETRVAPTPVRAPALALLCPDRAVLACLAANGVQERHRMALAARLDEVPQDVPVLVLHDAGADGLALFAAARAALGERAQGVGLLPRSVMHRDRARAVLLRTRPLRAAELAAQIQALRTSPARLTEAEVAWVADGWWSPVAAVPPAKLLAAVDRAAGRAAERAAEAADPARREARQLGFLTWPEAA
ncbi:hypothetical protein [Streptomyces sp. MP131-18]|uniref:hypothetical protein n=1 Tax=Streptomyces sp. MP131-18 TaxID=1857892 RepID=UPI00097C0D55|nr:hypothetical protein [Streptomyces sp. MP131-18]ONK11265.1 hypothetical protein STBA_19960 [Streptomyces sp. MP131-18]